MSFHDGLLNARPFCLAALLRVISLQSLLYYTHLDAACRKEDFIAICSGMNALEVVFYDAILTSQSNVMTRYTCLFLIFYILI